MNTSVVYDEAGSALVGVVSRTKKPVIICVDDEQMVLTSLKSQLKRHLGNDYIIETVDSAEEAIEVFNEHLSKNTAVPLVISDQIMPGMKGDEFLKVIHSINNSTLKILLTGQASAEAIGNAVNYASLYRYIAKPWEQTDLNLTVSEAVRCYFQSEQLETQNKLLKEYAETLEQKIEERTREVSLQKAQLELKNRDITASINYASFIQKAMLPPQELMKSSLKDYFVFYKPRDIVSGDFYWFSEKGDKLILIAADCTGHGVPGGFMSIIGCNSLNEIINKEKNYIPSSILKELDKRIKRVLNQDVTQNNDGLDIAVCVFDKTLNTLTFAGANNSLLLIEGDEMREFKANSKSIGGFLNIAESDYVFTDHIVPASANSQFYIFSDGFADQFGGTKNKKVLRKNFYNLLFTNRSFSLDAQGKAVSQFFDDWKGDNDQVDDVLVVGFKLL